MGIAKEGLHAGMHIEDEVTTLGISYLPDFAMLELPGLSGRICQPRLLAVHIPQGNASTGAVRACALLKPRSCTSSGCVQGALAPLLNERQGNPATLDKHVQMGRAERRRHGCTPTPVRSMVIER